MNRHTLRRLGESILDLVFAPVCLACDGAIAPGAAARLVCGRCRSRLRTLPAPACPRCGAPRLRTGREPGPTCRECHIWPADLRSARSACLLHPPADRIVHQLKYRGWSALGAFMGERMAALALPRDVEREARIVVPVPTTRKRMRTRGYNQAALIAQGFARSTGRRVEPWLLREAARGSQTTLQPAARRANVAGAFHAAHGVERRIRGAHVILVDDVLTTGATAVECSRVLVEAGARCVSLVTFARALDARRLTQS
jgi:ComF family protein